MTEPGALPVGTYPFVVYGHDPVTNTFNHQQQRTVTVTMGPNIASGFGDDNVRHVNPVDLDDAFTIVTSPSPTSGGVILFGSPSPSPRTCVGSSPNGRVYVSTTRTHATVELETQTEGPEKISVLCGGGR